MFYVNSTLEIEGKVRKRDGTLFNPSGIRVFVTNPSGVTTTYIWGTDAALQQAEDTSGDPIVGVFVLTYTPTQPGTYSYVFESYGDFTSKTKNIFHVEKT
jgi:hypothetical protein